MYCGGTGPFQDGAQGSSVVHLRRASWPGPTAANPRPAARLPHARTGCWPQLQLSCRSPAAHSGKEEEEEFGDKQKKKRRRKQEESLKAHHEQQVQSLYMFLQKPLLTMSQLMNLHIYPLESIY